MNEQSEQNLEINESSTESPKTKIALWNVKSTNLLITSRLTKENLFSSKSVTNKGWESVLNDMRNAGFEKLSLVQIKKKWFNIYAKYKNIKEIDNRDDVEWPHFETIDKYLNNKNMNHDNVKNNSTESNSSNKNTEAHSNCRLCQETEGIYLLKTDLNLCKQIRECTSLNILKDVENFPSSICNECKTLINTFHKFLLRCRRIDKKLRETFKPESEKTESSTFNCDECPMMLTSDESLKEHIRSHKKNKRYYCEICNKSFSRITTLNVHVKKHEDPNKNDKMDIDDDLNNGDKDDVDDYSEDVRDNDDTHNDNDDSDNDNVVENESFVNDNIKETENGKNDNIELKEKDVEKIDKSTPKEKIKEKFNCDLCAKPFDRRSYLKKHLERTHNNVKYMCPRQECNKTYTTVKALRNHEKKHMGLNRFLCVSCGKGFVDKSGLVSHEKIHLDIKEYVCNVCSRGFSTMGNLTTHRKKHHQGHRFYCSQCPKAFLAKCSLQRHELVHTGIKEFACDLCDGAFYTSKELIKHKRYHQGVRPYHCNQCFKTFYEKHHLTIHTRSHTGERPYPCKIPGCGKSFTDSNKVNRHMRRTH